MKSLEMYILYVLHLVYGINPIIFPWLWVPMVKDKVEMEARVKAKVSKENYQR